MPVGCPTCGTQNPDGSQFCQNCRTPLMAGPVGPPPMAPSPPPMAPPPPSAPPPGYGAPPPVYAAQAAYAPAYGAPAPSPYYTPAGAPMPVHRTPTGLIIGGGIAAFILIAILAVAGAFIFGSRNTGNHVAPTPPPTSAPPTIAPTVAPSSSPGTKATPTPTPTSTSKPTPTTGAIETNTFTMGLAPGFKKIKSDTISALVTNDTGNIYVSAGKQDHESSLDNEFTGIVDTLKQKYSQVSQCTKPADFTVDGIKGTIWGFNYLFTPQGGQAVKVCDLFFIAIPSSDKTIFYEVELFMADSDFDKFANGSALPEVGTIHWKSF